MNIFSVSLTLFVGIAACSSSGVTTEGPVPTEPTDSGQGAGECTFPLPISAPVATTCPANCVAVSGMQIDTGGQCVRAVLVGCLSCPTGCGGAPEGPCYKNTNDGRVARVPTYAVEKRSDWVSCTPAEDAQFAALPRCQ